MAKKSQNPANHGIAHRVLRLFTEGRERWFQTQGDARPQPDPAAPVTRVIGRVVDVERARPIPARGPRRKAAGLAPVTGKLV